MTRTCQTTIRPAEGEAPVVSGNAMPPDLTALPAEVRNAVAQALREHGADGAVQVKVTTTHGPIRVVQDRVVRTYKSVAEMPPELRAQFEAASQRLPPSSSAVTTRIRVTVNGKTQEYNSPDESPSDGRPSAKPGSP